MSSAKWYRVIDPLNPLCGCDVTIEDEGDDGFCVVTALRKLDVLMGDRPYQLRVVAGQNLGVSVFGEHLVESPIQDEIVEIAYDLPHGRCVDEQIIEGVDEELRVVTYERAIQVAYGAPEGELYATSTLRGDDRTQRATDLVMAFNEEDGRRLNREDICAMIVRENH
jgi:hypothetical protein